MALVVTIVVPVHNETGNITVLYQRLQAVSMELDAKYNLEVLYVNDGSTDETLAEIMALIKEGHSVGLVDLAQQFGHQIALEAGLYKAGGDIIITMDGDLQHPPEEITRMIEEYENGAEIVHMARKERAKNFKSNLSRIFYSFFSFISKAKPVPNSADFKLMTSKVVAVFNSVASHGKCLRVILPALEFKQTVLYYDEANRFSGRSAYTYRRSFNLAIDSIFTSSRFPFVFAFSCGLILITVAALVLGLELVQIPTSKDLADIWPPLLYSGSILISLSVISGYMYYLLQRRNGIPAFIIENFIAPAHS